MGYICATLLVAALVSLSSGAQLVRVFTEEFDTLDLTKWQFQTGCDGFGNNEKQCYTTRPQNARIENGVLILQALKEQWADNTGSQDFTSAKLTSTFSMQYGLIEVRARFPAGKNLWPAIWMLSQNSDYGVWPRSGELDICEYRGQRTNQIIGTAHYGQAWNIKTDIGTGERNFTTDFSQDWHTFALNWDPNSLTWLLDGQVIQKVDINRNLWDGVYTGNTQPFDKPFYFILNLAVSGAFFPPSVFGDFNTADADSWTKSTMEVDWIHGSQWK